MFRSIADATWNRSKRRGTGMARGGAFICGCIFNRLFFWQASIAFRNEPRDDQLFSMPPAWKLVMKCVFTCRILLLAMLHIAGDSAKSTGGDHRSHSLDHCWMILSFKMIRSVYPLNQTSQEGSRIVHEGVEVLATWWIFDRFRVIGKHDKLLTEQKWTPPMCCAALVRVQRRYVIKSYLKLLSHWFYRVDLRNTYKHCTKSRVPTCRFFIL